jgi:putative hydrolase of the HAD superfamily
MSPARKAPKVWLFDLDNTLHDAGAQVFPELKTSMTLYMQQQLQVDEAEANRLRGVYLARYGATLLGLIRHHGVQAPHFLHETHQLPGLEQYVGGHRHDVAALKRLRGRRFILTNAPRAYALRVLGALRIAHLFDGVLSMEDMFCFGHCRPKPDARMLRMVAARLRVAPACCVLVEDTLVHQKAARSLGMGTVWMQRFARRGSSGGMRWSMRPAYVDRVVRGLRPLLRA